MIDWHSHILPNMDDGSRDLDESIEMLKALKQQGVDIVVATPHFCADAESVDEFLNRRQKAYDALCSGMDDLNVSVICGAEVRYYPGISRMESLERLAIEGTRLLLLEMPVTKWTDHTFKELVELAGMRGVKVVMAHIERYLALQNKDMLNRLIENGIFVQVNASFFDRFRSRQKAIKLLTSGCIHYIGSDCHNMTTRPPRIASAYELIRRKLGNDFASQMIDYGYQTIDHRL